mgnify:CR=1 FL=1
MTGAPTLAAGRLYVPLSSGEEVAGANPKYECCKFRGSLSALDAATGKSHLEEITPSREPRTRPAKPAGGATLGTIGRAGIWSSPTIDL